MEMVLYLKDGNNDLARFTKKRLRETYSVSNLNNHEVYEIEEARDKLLKFKSEGMNRWDWKYKEDIQYLWSKISSKEISPDELALFYVLQESFKVIMMNDDTEEIEMLHLALVEAFHEWNFLYRFEAAAIKEEHKEEWWNIIETLANRLCDIVNSYNDEYKERFEERDVIAL